jgi:hypothetical protein
MVAVKKKCEWSFCFLDFAGSQGQTHNRFHALQAGGAQRNVRDGRIEGGAGRVKEVLGATQRVFHDDA